MACTREQQVSKVGLCFFKGAGCFKHKWSDFPLRTISCGVKMDKRAEKRHKRQVSRAKKRVKLSEPDVRTPEQIQAAREASRPIGGYGNGGNAKNSGSPFRNSFLPGTGSAAKTGV